MKQERGRRNKKRKEVNKRKEREANIDRAVIGDRKGKSERLSEGNEKIYK